MAITKEDLLQRREALLNDYNAIGGALQDVDFWLGRLAQEEADEKKQDTVPEPKPRE